MTGKEESAQATGPVLVTGGPPTPGAIGGWPWVAFGTAPIPTGRSLADWERLDIDAFLWSHLPVMAMPVLGKEKSGAKAVEDAMSLERAAGKGVVRNVQHPE